MRRIFAWAMVAALTGLLGTVQAGSIVVNTASGSIGGITLTNEGINGSGTAIILISGVPNNESFLNNVNGVTVAPDPVAVKGPITLLVTPTAVPGNYDLALSPSTYTAVFGTTPGAQGIVTFDQMEGEAPLLLHDFFNLSGHIDTLVSNLEPTYDFRNVPGGILNFTITGTTFTGTTSFVGLISTPGAKVTASGSFSLSAVPEPASAVMMGMGGVVLVALVLRRRKS
jgi:hypothetical protein